MVRPKTTDINRTHNLFTKRRHPVDILRRIANIVQVEIVDYFIAFSTGLETGQVGVHADPYKKPFQNIERDITL
jgi:hypothetical protein